MIEQQSAKILIGQKIDKHSDKKVSIKEGHV